VVELVALRVRRDVEVEQEQLAVLDDAVGVGEVGLAVPQRLDLGAGQHDARLPLVENVVVVACALVPRDRAVFWIRVCGHRADAGRAPRGAGVTRNISARGGAGSSSPPRDGAA
jgi:hypothetical protein